MTFKYIFTTPRKSIVGQAGAELDEAQVKLEVIDEVWVEVEANII